MEIENYIACHDCDLIHHRQKLDQGETAYCHRCGARLFYCKANMIDRSLALNLCPLILYIVAVSLPFLGLASNGIEVQITLFESVSALYGQQMKALSVLVFMVLLFVPVIRVLAMIYLLVSVKLDAFSVYHRRIYRLIESISAWNMAEVFLIGLLVTFVKLGSDARIILNVSFWVFITLVLTIAASNAVVDRDSLWRALKGVK